MWNLLAMGSSYQRGLEEGMKTGFSAVQLFKEEQLNDAKYEGSILGWARRNYQGRVKGFTVFNPDKKDMPKSYELKQAVGVLKRHMGSKADLIDAALGLPDVVSGDKEQQQAIKRASKNPAQWFSKVIRDLNDSESEVYGFVPVEPYTIKDDDVEYSGDAISFVNNSGAKLFFTRGSVAARIEPIQGKIKPEHLSPSPYNPRQATRIATTSSSDERPLPLQLFQTLTEAGVEAKEANETVTTLLSESEEEPQQPLRTFINKAKPKTQQPLRTQAPSTYQQREANKLKTTVSYPNRRRNSKVF